MDFSGTFEDFQKVIRENGGDIQIMEREVGLDTQMAYMRMAKEVKKNLSPHKAMAGRFELWDENSSAKSKRYRLATIASLGSPDAIRTLQSYQESPDRGLEDWTYLALQECKLIFQASMLDHPPMFISTGLGGHGQQLRFFGAFFSDDGQPFEDTRKKVISGEVEYMFSKFGGKLEFLAFSGQFVTFWGLVPIDVSLNEKVQAAIDESNLLGAGLRKDFVLTNVKKLTFNELGGILEKIKSGKLGQSNGEQPF
ncbi:hypothetical protein [Marinilabilia salmonicolor]|jgi:hypothetical protein|uniref:Uncharacterized protein n=1 Tax=Marinilabilia salmonicolor TaxID=989 RepID=A0A2T0WTI8_9BACT|nr:hypothetical protein [Marinilabilia salmonicolor]PRY90013.1 hypothetical protein BY457_12820 [Marinilabilia salmonicolor]RCW28826.1 hypothetical protein DFO77_1359 [Marinilabilia salmonicolor]